MKKTSLAIVVVCFQIIILGSCNNKLIDEELKMDEKETVSIKINSVIEHKELKQDGYSIHYYVTGDSSKELIVFLHPAFADHRCFDKQVDYFAKDYRVLTIDMIGHGLSKVNKAKDKIDATVNHIDTILKIEGYKEAHFVGVSVGSLIAQYYALKHSNIVLSLSILGGYDINADNKEVEKAQRSEQIKWIFKAIFSMNSFRKHVASISVTNPDEQKRFYKMAQLFTRKSFMIMSGLGNVLKVRADIKRNYPIMIMVGDNDIELAKRMSIDWHKSEPTSRYILLKRAGHCANMDNSDDFNRNLFEFIKQK
ncbi:MAG: alpha/beta hydrolase [Bacteroidales bacterium]|nr:alpha/beta hydrolase [Bacteroidales bacterium]